MLTTILALCALLLEGLAGQRLLAGDGDSVLVVSLAIHAGASLALAGAAWFRRPWRERPGHAGLAALTFSVALCIPGLGLAGALLALVLLPLLPTEPPAPQFATVAWPEFDRVARTGGRAGLRQAGMRHFLGNPVAPLEQRLRALVGLGHTPAQLASPMLQDLLADQSDDLRLLAYGMLDRREQELNAAIHATHHAREKTDNPVERAALARRLAELYWELIYQGLVHGDLRAHAANTALTMTVEALSLSPGDAGLHLRHGRLLQLAGSPREALAAYRRALAQGLPKQRVLPYMAELAFCGRDFKSVRSCLAALAARGNTTRLQPIIRYWSQA